MSRQSANYQRILNSPIQGVGVRISEARRAHYSCGQATAGYYAQANEQPNSDAAGCHDPHPAKAATPEKRLALAIIWQAHHDLTGAVDIYTEMPEGSRVNAIRWINSDDRKWPFSFANMCELVGFDANEIRASLKGRGLLEVGHGRLRLVHQAGEVRRGQS